MTEVKTVPFLGWTNDKDILNQQREYWGAMNGIKALQEENKMLRELLGQVNHTLVCHNKVDRGTPLHERILFTLNEEKK